MILNHFSDGIRYTFCPLGRLERFVFMASGSVTGSFANTIAAATCFPTEEKESGTSFYSLRRFAHDSTIYCTINKDTKGTCKLLSGGKTTTINNATAYIVQQ